MKLQVMFKSPDAVHNSLQDAGFSTKCGVVDSGDPDAECYESIEQVLRQWIKWGECITVEFDTEAGTATVVPV